VDGFRNLRTLSGSEEIMTILPTTSWCDYRLHEEYVFQLESDPASIPPVVSHVLQQAGRLFEPCERWQMHLQTSLEEAMMNGMLHGNLEISSDVREDVDVSIVDLMNTRRQAAPFSGRLLSVRLRFTEASLTVGVEDEGPGFDTATLPDPTDDEYVDRCHGRGVMLMNAFMDVVQFNAQGNSVTLVKHRPPAILRAG